MSKNNILRFRKDKGNNKAVIVKVNFKSEAKELINMFIKNNFIVTVQSSDLGGTRIKVYGDVYIIQNIISRCPVRVEKIRIRERYFWENY